MPKPLSRIRRASDAGVELGAAFREAMSHLAATVVMVTTTIDEKPWALTISACCSVSAKPPTILVSLGSATASAGAIHRGGTFGVSILGEGGIEAARAGARPGVPKFAEHLCRPEEVAREGQEGTLRTPVLRGAVAHLDCAVVREVEVADHTVFFAEVRDIVLSPGTPPLIYWGRDYAEIDRGEPWYG
ncbi:MAG: flavin reductase family protein [Solirubrobacterales bacterium]